MSTADPKPAEPTEHYPRARRHRRLLAGSTAAVLVVAAGTWALARTGPAPRTRTGGASAAPHLPVTYLTSFGTFGRDAYAHVALARGYFADEGLDVTIRPGTGTENIKIVAAGKAEFAAVDFTGGVLQIVNATGERPDVRAVALIHQQTLAAIMALESSGITTARDLEGKTIADIPASVVRLLFPYYATLAKFDPTTVKWVNANPQQLLGMLTGAAGQVDAISQFVVGAPTVETINKGKVRVLPFTEFVMDLPGNALWASGRMLRENPQAVAGFRRALLRGLDDALAHPDEAGQILHAAQPLVNAASAAAELRKMASYCGTTNRGMLTGQQAAKAIALLQSVGAIPAGVAPPDILANPNA